MNQVIHGLVSEGWREVLHMYFHVHVALLLQHLMHGLCANVHVRSTNRLDNVCKRCSLRKHWDEPLATAAGYTVDCIAHARILQT